MKPSGNDAANDCPIGDPANCPVEPGKRGRFLHVFSAGDIMTLVIVLVTIGVSWGIVITKLDGIELEHRQDIAAINAVIAQIPRNTTDLAVLKDAVIRGENDRRELKQDLLERMKMLEEQNREILRILSKLNGR